MWKVIQASIGEYLQSVAVKYGEGKFDKCSCARNGEFLWLFFMPPCKRLLVVFIRNVQNKEGKWAKAGYKKWLDVVSFVYSSMLNTFKNYCVLRKEPKIEIMILFFVTDVLFYNRKDLYVSKGCDHKNLLAKKNGSVLPFFLVKFTFSCACFWISMYYRMFKYCA